MPSGYKGETILMDKTADIFIPKQAFFNLEEKKKNQVIRIFSISPDIKIFNDFCKYLNLKNCQPSVHEV